MPTPATCAVCDKEGISGTVECLAPYGDVARANGWAHPYAHLDCARYRVATVFAQEPTPDEASA